MADSIYVKIRTWDDMLQKYGTKHSDRSIIDIPNGFTRQMEKMMPTDRIIKVQIRIKKDSYLWHYDKDVYIISKEMVEHNYGHTDPRTDPSIILPTKDTKISEPKLNHARHEYYLVAADKNYLHSDMIIRTSTMPYETGYYPTEQSALFAKLRFKRLQQKGLLHDFSKPKFSASDFSKAINSCFTIPDSDTTCSS